MTRIVAMVFIVCCWIVSYAQTDPQGVSQTEEIRAAIDKVWQSGEPSINGVLYDLRTFEGKLIHMDDESFSVSLKKGSKQRGLMTIKFKQILELNGKGVSISYFPDPNLTPFADWNAVNKLTYGDTLEVERIVGGNVFGVLFRVSDTSITLMDGNRPKEIERDEVKRIFLARRESHSIAKALKGAGKGASSVGRGSGSSQIGAAAVEGAIRVAAATAGAVTAVARRSPNDRLLIYAQ